MVDRRHCRDSLQGASHIFRVAPDKAGGISAQALLFALALLCASSRSLLCELMVEVELNSHRDECSIAQLSVLSGSERGQSVSNCLPTRPTVLYYSTWIQQSTRSEREAVSTWFASRNSIVINYARLPRPSWAVHVGRC